MDNKLDGKSLDLTAENVEKIKAIFPSVVAEGKIDADKLLTLLGEAVDEGKEKYAFTWKGKMDAIRIAQTRSAGTLRPCKEESVNWDTTQNLYIEGNNLEVLKLLAASYHGAIKMIYIDPPYNTGKDFVYKDSFGDSIENYKQITGQAQTSNPETAGRYHTNWLNMMYPRLKLAHVLLKEEGIIFISIDEIEMPNLRKICDEIFGEDNHIADFAWHNKRGGGNDSKHVAVEHEYVLMYAKSITELGELFVPYKPEYLTRYKEEDEVGKFFWDTFKRKSGKQYYPITCPDGTVLEFDEMGNPISWLRSEARFKSDLKESEVRFINYNGKWSVQFKQRLPEGKKPRSIFLEESILDEQGTTSDGSAEALAIFGSNVFDNPKPVELLKHLISFHTTKNDIVLDFFSGSGTAAQAVMELNSDGEKRRFILVQLPENLEKNLEKASGGSKTIIENAIRVCNDLKIPHTISELAKERIRRAGVKIAEENRMTAPDLDIGFKVLKLDSTNLIVWDNSYTEDEEEVAKRAKQQSLFYLKDDRTDLDLVMEIMLKNGRQLTDKITEAEVKGAKVYIIENPEYKILVCLQPNINLNAVEAMISDLPPIGTFIFADRCFKDVNEVLNTREILRKNSRNFRLF